VGGKKKSEELFTAVCEEGDHFSLCTRREEADGHIRVVYICVNGDALRAYRYKDPRALPS
jgi:hypothetical protein